MLQEILAILKTVIQIRHRLLGFYVDFMEALVHVVNIVSTSAGRKQQKMRLTLGLLMNRDNLLAQSLSLLQVPDCFYSLDDLTSL